MNPSSDPYNIKIAQPLILTIGPTALFAALLPALFGAYINDDGANFVRLCLATIPVAAFQMAWTVFCAGLLERRVNDEDTITVPLVTMGGFALKITLGVVFIGLIFGPLAMIWIQIVGKQSPFDLLEQYGLVYGLFQLVFTVVVARFTLAFLRSASVYKIAPGGIGYYFGYKTASRSVFLSLFLAALMVAVGLGVAAQKLIGKDSLESKVVSYQKVLTAVMGTLNGDVDVAQIVSSFTHFDESYLFSFNTMDWQQGLKTKDVVYVKQQLGKTQMGSWTNHSAGYGIVWYRFGDRGEAVGVLVKASETFGLPLLFIGLLVASGFGSVLMSLLFGARIREDLVRRIEVVNGLPGGEIPKYAGRTVSADVDAFDQMVVTVKERYNSFLYAKKAMLVAGRESRDQKAQVFANMSHDLKGPLNSIIGFSELLLKGMDGELEPDQKAAVCQIAEESEILLVVIGDVLDTAKLDAGKFELDLSWVPSVEILTDCTAGVRRLIGFKPITFDAVFEPGLPPVKVDKERITRAVLSMLARALYAMEKGTLRLEAARERDGKKPTGRLRVDIVVPVEEIPDSLRAHIVEAFNRNENILSDGTFGGTGLGLGLALSRRILRLHGGDVEIEESGAGDFRFKMTLSLDELKP